MIMIVIIMIITMIVVAAAAAIIFVVSCSLVRFTIWFELDNDQFLKRKILTFVQKTLYFLLVKANCLVRTVVLLNLIRLHIFRLQTHACVLFWQDTYAIPTPSHCHSFPSPLSTSSCTVELVFLMQQSMYLIQTEAIEL